jgi:hypothetical protein
MRAGGEGGMKRIEGIKSERVSGEEGKGWGAMGIGRGLAAVVLVRRGGSGKVRE